METRHSLGKKATKLRGAGAVLQNNGAGAAQRKFLGARADVVLKVGPYIGRQLPKSAPFFCRLWSTFFL